MNILLSQPNLDKKELKSIVKVYNKKWLLNGPTVQKFEKNFKKKFNFKYCSAVSSCTAGLQLVLSSLNLKKGDEVILSSFNFIAAGLSILQSGLKPVFVDLKKDSFDLDIEKLKKKINKKTKVIILTHFNGYLQPVDKLLKKIKKFKKLKIIEDASHVLGAHYKKKFSGKKTFAAAYSFGPTKMITTAGMGGMVVSENKNLIKKINILKSYGMNKSSFSRAKLSNNWNYKIESLGNNFRMTEIQASVGIEQLKKIEKFIKKREDLKSAYKKLINNKFVKFQESDCTSKSALIYFAIILKNKKTRDDLAKYLISKKISISVHWDPPLSQQRLFSNYANKEFKNSENLSGKILSLPLHTKLNFNEIEYISNKINMFFKKNKIEI